jgi:ligand-binding sensor domain-containing protein
MNIRNIFLLVSLFGMLIKPSIPKQKLMHSADSISVTQTNWRSYTYVSTVWALASKGNTLWAGTDGGVVRLNTIDFSYTKYTFGDGLANNHVRAIAIDATENVWVGTEGE